METKIFPVNSGTNPGKLAGAIVAGLQSGNVSLSAIGPASTHKLVLAICIISQWGYKPAIQLEQSSTDAGTRIICTVRPYDANHTRVIE